MRNKVPVPRENRAPLPDFTPVPLRYRHDGWTPERQRGFIEALADTGCVSRATAIVNMSLEGVYYLRRQKGAEEFRAAWNAALDFGVQKLKDIAFERAIEGEMIPVFEKGKLMGYRRKRNDRLLMFCLRHYGQDANGKRTTINYFSSRAQAGAGSGVGSGVGSGEAGSGAGGSIAAAEASTTTVRTVITGNGINGTGNAANIDDAARTLENFEGIELDAEAQAAITAALEACAARYRAAGEVIEGGGDDALALMVDDPDQIYAPTGKNTSPYHGELVLPDMLTEFVPFQEGESHWTNAGAELPYWAQPDALRKLEAPTGEVQKRKRKSNWKRKGAATEI